MKSNDNKSVKPQHLAAVALATAVTLPGMAILAEEVEQKPIGDIQIEEMQNIDVQEITEDVAYLEDSSDDIVMNESGDYKKVENSIAKVDELKSVDIDDSNFINTPLENNDENKTEPVLEESQQVDELQNQILDFTDQTNFSNENLEYKSETLNNISSEDKDNEEILKDTFEEDDSNQSKIEIQKQQDELNSNLELLKNNSPENYENLKKANYALYRSSLSENEINKGIISFEDFNLNVYLANLIATEGDNPYNNCTRVYPMFMPGLRASSPSEILMRDLESKEAFKTLVIEYEVLGYSLESSRKDI